MSSDSEDGFLSTTNQVNTPHLDLQGCCGEKRGTKGAQSLGPTLSEALVTGSYVDSANR